MIRATLVGLAVLGFLVAVIVVRADDMETLLMRQVRLTTDAALTNGCTKLTTVSDDSVKDLRKKIVRAGGNTGLLTFGVADLSRMSPTSTAAPRRPRARRRRPRRHRACRRPLPALHRHRRPGRRVSGYIRVGA